MVSRIVVLAALPALGHELLGAPVRRRGRRPGAGAAAIVTDPASRSMPICSTTPAASLEVVANFGVGYDNIDLDAARARGVRVTNTPGVLTNATAELAVALMLASARRIAEADAARFAAASGSDRLPNTSRSAGSWPARPWGSWASAVSADGSAELLRGFRVRLLFTSRSTIARRLAWSAATLPDLLAASDFVSVHVPLTPETRHLIDANALAAMRPGAILVNTSRGAVVDTRRSSMRCARAIWAPPAWTSTRTSRTCRRNCASCPTPSCCRTSDRRRPRPGTRWRGYVLRT